MKNSRDLILGEILYISIIYRIPDHELVKTQQGTMGAQLPGGGGGTPLYGPYRYVRPQRVWFFGCFAHK